MNGTVSRRIEFGQAGLTAWPGSFRQSQESARSALSCKKPDRPSRGGGSLDAAE
jgi:hypothetical protein